MKRTGTNQGLRLKQIEPQRHRGTEKSKEKKKAGDIKRTLKDRDMSPDNNNERDATNDV